MGHPLSEEDRAMDKEPRKYALIKLDTGDYLCPSNDKSTLWRFQRYEDGRFYGLDVDYEARTFWRVLRRPMPTEFTEHLLDVGDWTEVQVWLPTRAAALAVVFS
jgi:hypothetical protein